MAGPAQQRRHNTIRTFALICVAVTSVFIMGMRIWSTDILASEGWCDRALGAVEQLNAEKLRTKEAITACFKLLNEQVEALARNTLIDAGVIGLCLLVLMVIVVAGGKLSFTGNKSGVGMTMGRDGEPLPAPVRHTLEDAAEVGKDAEDVLDQAQPTKPTVAPAAEPELEPEVAYDPENAPRR